MFLNQGVTVYTRAAEKKYGVLKYIGNISEVAALARYSLGSNHLKRFPALVFFPAFYLLVKVAFAIGRLHFLIH